MQREQTHTRKLDRFRNGLCHGIGDVVKFQVQENLGAGVRELTYGSRTLGCEELAANFEEPNGSAKLPCQSGGSLEIIDIQGDD
jgi:hypothetical protein